MSLRCLAFLIFNFLSSQILFSQNSNKYIHYEVRNESVLIREMDYNTFGNSLTTHVKYIEDIFYKTKKQDYNNYHRIYRTNFNKKDFRIYIYLIPKEKVSNCVWKKYDNTSDFEGKVKAYNFNIKTKIVSKSYVEYIIPSL